MIGFSISPLAFGDEISQATKLQWKPARRLDSQAPASSVTKTTVVAQQESQAADASRSTSESSATVQDGKLRWHAGRTALHSAAPGDTTSATAAANVEPLPTVSETASRVGADRTGANPIAPYRETQSVNTAANTESFENEETPAPPWVASQELRSLGVLTRRNGPRVVPVSDQSSPRVAQAAGPLLRNLPLPGDGRPVVPPFREAFQQGAPSLEVDCDAERQKLKPISAITTKIAAEPGELPPECGPTSDVFRPRDWPLLTYTWKASNLCHKPLYFEEVGLERYGHSVRPPFQPIVSVAHFFASVPLLPYKMGVNPPNECIYVLGYYRPGDCAPYIVPPIPLSARGAAFQAAAVTGFIGALQ
jgi:hypothetical protein